MAQDTFDTIILGGLERLADEAESFGDFVAGHEIRALAQKLTVKIDPNDAELREVVLNHHLAQIEAHGVGTPLCQCVECVRYRAALAASTPVVRAESHQPTVTENQSHG